MTQLVPVGDFTHAVIFSPPPEQLLVESPEYHVLVFNVGVLGGSAASAVYWADVEDKPATFPPSAHTHTPEQAGADPAGTAETLFNELASTVSLGLSLKANTTDPRFTDPRTPTGSAGGDLGGTYPNPTVQAARGLRETQGPTALSMGTLAAGQLLARINDILQGMAGVTWDDTQRLLTLLATFTGTTGGGIRIQQTWNNASGTFVPFVIDVTNTASGGNSRFCEFYSGGSLGFGVNRFFNIVGGSYNAGTGVVNAGTLSIGGTAGIFGGSSDVLLVRAAANTMAQRNGTTPQAHRVNNTHSNDSNGEWFCVRWTANVCYVEPQANGTGVVRPMIVRSPAVALASLPTASAAGAGARSVISDSNVAMSGNFGAVAASGGSNVVPVLSDGTNWRIG